MIYFGMADIGGAIIMFGVTYFVGSYYSEGSDHLISNFREKVNFFSTTRYLYCNVYT